METWIRPRFASVLHFICRSPGREDCLCWVMYAAQGDGEICGSALEICAEVQLKLGLIKNQIEWPRVINDDGIMVVGSSRPLIEAYKIAHVELLKWLVSDYGFDKMDALQLVSQVVKCSIANTVDPNFTVAAKFPRKYLPSGD